MRIVLRVLAVLVGLLLLAAGSVYALSSLRLGRVIAISEVPPAIATDSVSLERGDHLAMAIGKCVDCHGEDFGGRVVFDAMPFARIVAPNLTTGHGGVGAALTDAQLVTAIRHGVGPTGRALVLMPSSGFWYFTDTDIAALGGYVRTRPPVDRELPSTAFGPVGRTLYVAGKLGAFFEAATMDHDAPRPAVPEPGPTPGYGEYLARVGGCTGCHGPGLSGGVIPDAPPDAPPAQNLTPEGIGNWTEEDFFRALRQARRPDGTAINAFMPVQFTKLMTDDEIRAVWAHLRTVPPRPTGSR